MTPTDHLLIGAAIVAGVVVTALLALIVGIVVDRRRVARQAQR